MLQDDDIAAAIGGDIRHLMVDEYQDVSRVQTGILQRLAGAHGNVAVVGDDDQAIHRFRGASVASILEFPRRFPGCRVLGLTTNYRSHRDIVAWPQAGGWTTAAPWEFEGRAFRYPKNIVPHRPEAHAAYPAVISVQGRDPVDEAGQLVDLLKFMSAQRRHRRVRPGRAATPQREGRRQRPLPGRTGAWRRSRPLRGRPATTVLLLAPKFLVTTIHQAKGLEWHLVIVGSLTGPDMATDRIGRNLADCGVYSGEPESLIGEFDQARAALRGLHPGAPCLLVLTASGEPQARFRCIWDEAARWPDVDRDALGRQRFGVAGHCAAAAGRHRSPGAAGGQAGPSRVSEQPARRSLRFSLRGPAECRSRLAGVLHECVKEYAGAPEYVGEGDLQLSLTKTAGQ